MSTTLTENKSQESISNLPITAENNDKQFKIKAGIFLSTVTGISAAIGFGTTLISVRKQDPKYFNKGLSGTIEMADTGANLALRALGWGTLYAFTGCGILFYSIWKLSGANNFNEFRQIIGNVLPRIPKNNPPQGRTEFTGLNDLLTYVSKEKDDDKFNR